MVSGKQLVVWVMPEEGVRRAVVTHMSCMISLATLMFQQCRGYEAVKDIDNEESTFIHGYMRM